MTTVTEFINTIFYDLLPGETIVGCIGKKLTTDMDEAGVAAVTAVNMDTYLLTATVSGARKENGLLSRTAADQVACYAVVFDDIGETKDDGRVIEAPPVVPTWALETSPGSEQWGYAIEAVDLPDARLKQLIDGAIAKGWCDPGATGGVRLVRVPGSVNTKPQHNGWRAKLIGWEPNRTWTLDDLARELGVELEETTQAQKVSQGHAAGTLIIGYDDPVLQWLADKGHVVGSANVPWVEIVCPWHAEAAGHTTGNTAFYSPAGAGSGSLEYSRAFKCHHDHSDAVKKTGDFLAWVADQGGPDMEQDVTVDVLLDRYAYLISSNEVCDMRADALTPMPTVQLAHFKAAWRKQVGINTHGNPVWAFDGWQTSPRQVKFEGQVTAPGEGRRVSANGVELWNNWGCPNHASVPAAPGEFLEHIKHVIPAHRERELFLDWLAYKIQHPAQRSYAMVMVADAPLSNVYGIGRSMIGDAIAKLLQAGVPSLELHELIGGAGGQSDFNDWAANAQVVIVEETKEEVGDWRSNTDHFEKLKKLIDVRVGAMRVKKKYGAIWDAKIYANFLFFTNHYNALKLPQGDRRFCVLENNTERRSPAGYARMAAFIDDRDAIAGLYWWLLERDVSRFDHARPPATAAKEMMQAGTQTPGDELLAMAVESLTGDLVHKAQLFHRVEVLGKEEDFDEHERDICKRLVKKLWLQLPKLTPSDRKNGGRMTVGSTTKPIRILRNVGQWELGVDASPTDLHRKTLKANDVFHRE